MPVYLDFIIDTENAYVTVRQFLFRYRSYTPIPFLIVMLIWAHPTLISVIVGGACILLGEAFRYWGVAHAGSETRTTSGVGASKLVTSGPFSFVRNPLYIGNMMIYCGIGVMSMALVPYLLIGAAAFFVLQYILIVNEEESFLVHEFGEEYELYRSHVRAWLPRFSTYPHATKRSPAWGAALRSEFRTFQSILLSVALLLIRWYLA